MLNDDPSGRAKVQRKPSGARSHTPAGRKRSGAVKGAPVRERAEDRKAGERRHRAQPAAQGTEESAAEREFRQAMQEYKERSGRMFPTWSEVLEVLRSLGYRRAYSFPSGRPA